MDGQGRLGDFLQARRARVRPEDVGLPTYGDRRRVPGLRREELALLAGVSAPYYARLEQGQSHNASPEVLDAIAGALRLDDSERGHLHALASPAARRRPVRRPPPEEVPAVTRALLAAVGDVPVIVLGRRTDVLAWNRMGHAVFAGHLDPAAPDDPASRPNMARLVFLDAHVRELYPDWSAKAKAVVGNLRVVVGLHPDDPLLAGLIGDLCVRSPEFAGMWADHRVRVCDAVDHRVHHPLVGSMTLTQQTLRSPRSGGVHVVVAVPEPGSASESALALLARSIAPRPGVRDGVRPSGT
ncbi:helix-turn-helix transcriptional regulator [Umezawaea sp.]|uniref:helix-turn-helix domain-containing protein n=1 Tax=Umezawaea sp. TaxID=1955258 RepID=UPI002ECFE031